MKTSFFTLVPALLIFGSNGARAEVKVRELHSTETSKAHGISVWPTPVVHFKGHSYYITPDTENRPVIAHVDADGKSSVSYLDPRPDYVAWPDPHNSFSIGIDEKGYVHVTGDMHQFGVGFSRDARYPYPERYDDKKGAKMLYWRSVKPWDTSAGFDFYGGAGSPHLMPGNSWSYGRFFNDAEGKLFYSARVRAKTAINYQLPDASQGSMGLGLYEYHSDNATWTAIGAHPKFPDADNIKYSGQVFFWANSGRMDTKGSYQVYMADFNFDTKGRLHAAISGTIGKENLARILYAYSDDRGQTWHKLDGSRIPGLPLRGEDGQENLADVVATMNTTTVVAVTADRDGRPAIKYGTSGTTGWYVHSEKGWGCKPTRPDGIPGNRAYILADGNLVFTAPWVVTITHDLSSGKFIGNTHEGGFNAASQLGALTTGKLYGLRTTTMEGGKIRLTLAEMTFTPDEFMGNRSVMPRTREGN